MINLILGFGSGVLAARLLGPEGLGEYAYALAIASVASIPVGLGLPTAVVRFLVAQGIPPDRLAATGFGAFQPLVPGNDEAAWRLNRRIEIKLTQR